jgi:shikimate dehydrogenase
MPAEVRHRAAVLGHPIGHSLSPVLHHSAYRALGLDDWDYGRVECTSDGLSAFVSGLDDSWAGLSLTMPLKQEVLRLLDERDPLVDATGAANTVVLREGRRLGFNTDVEGIVRALDELTAETLPEAVVLGGGATACSSIAALAARGTHRVYAYLRRVPAGDVLVTTGRDLGVEVRVLPWDTAAQGLGRGLVVSTVPRGVADHLVPAVPEAPGVLLDVVYDPWPTALAAAWTARGGQVASGLAMLLHQSVAQVRLMTGLEPPVEVMRAALLEAAALR